MFFIQMNQLVALRKEFPGDHAISLKTHLQAGIAQSDLFGEGLPQFLHRFFSRAMTGDDSIRCPAAQRGHRAHHTLPARLQQMQSA